MQGNNLTILAPGTYLKGELVSGDTLVIEGGVEGNVKGNRIIVKSQGWVHGDVICRSLSIEPGGVVDGAVRVEVGGQALLGSAAQGELPEAQDAQDGEDSDDNMAFSMSDSDLTPQERD